MWDKESNRNGVAKTTNEEIFNSTHQHCSSQRIYLWIEHHSFHFAFCFFFVCMCCGWCCQNWMSNYNNNNRIWANNRKREMNGPIMPFCCCCSSTSTSTWTSMKTNTLDVREYQLLNQFSSFVSMNDAFNITIVVIVVVGEHCFLHIMLCTARLLHLHIAMHTHTHTLKLYMQFIFHKRVVETMSTTTMTMIIMMRTTATATAAAVPIQPMPI